MKIGVKSILPFAFLCAATSVASESGIGISTKSGDIAIYVPVKISDTMFIEPELTYLKDKYTEGQGVDTLEVLQLKVGIFNQVVSGDNYSVYAGARVGFEKRESKFTSAYNSDSSSDMDGYNITPTIGVEYFFNSRLSLAGEAGISYSNLTGKYRYGFTAEDIDNTLTKTQTRLILRCMF